MILDMPDPNLAAEALAALVKYGVPGALIVLAAPLIEFLKLEVQKRRTTPAAPPSDRPVTIAIDAATVRAAVEAAHAPALSALHDRVASIEERHAEEDRAAELAAAEARGAERARAEAARTTGEFATAEPTDGGNSVPRRRPR